MTGMQDATFIPERFQDKGGTANQPEIVQVLKADDRHGGAPVEPICLVVGPERIGKETGDNWEARAKGVFKHEAEKIMHALLRLPQGTLDQLAILMLQRQASLLVIAVKGPGE